jgi:hypothetical protein
MTPTPTTTISPDPTTTSSPSLLWNIAAFERILDRQGRLIAATQALCAARAALCTYLVSTETGTTYSREVLEACVIRAQNWQTEIELESATESYAALSAELAARKKENTNA